MKKNAVVDRARLLCPDGFIAVESLNYEGEHLSDWAKSTASQPNDKILVPGFVDLQIYGAAGKLFSADPSEENLKIIEDELLQQGCTSFYLCLATNTPEVFNRCISVLKSARANLQNCMGLHLEGPFLNPVKRGAHVASYIRKAELDEVKALLDFGDGLIKMMTLAPELQDDNVIDFLLQQGITVSLGHSNATFEQANAAYNRGIQTTTHLFNAMSAIQHRAPGIPTAVFNHPKAMASIIADGLHVDFEIVKMAHKVMGNRLFLITDAVTDCDSGPYQHKAVDGKFILPDGTLSGSALSMLQAVKNCVSFCGIALDEALQMATLYPAKLIGEENQIGQLVEGAKANIVQLSDKLELERVIFKGQEIQLNDRQSY